MVRNHLLLLKRRRDQFVSQCSKSRVDNIARQLFLIMFLACHKVRRIDIEPVYTVVVKFVVTDCGLPFIIFLKQHILPCLGQGTDKSI